MCLGWLATISKSKSTPELLDFIVFATLVQKRAPNSSEPRLCELAQNYASLTWKIGGGCSHFLLSVGPAVDAHLCGKRAILVSRRPNLATERSALR